MALFRWMSFKFQLFAVPIGDVNVSLKDLVTGKTHSRQATKAWRQSRSIALLYPSSR